MCLPWPGDFLLPEALKVITVEEDLSSAAMSVWSSPQHFAPLTLPKITAIAATAARAHTEKSILSFFLPLFTNDIFSLISGYNHHDDSCINCLTTCSSTSHNPDTSTVEVTWLWIDCGIESATHYRSIDSHWFLWSGFLCWLRLLSVLQNNWVSSRQYTWITCALELAGTCSCLALWFIQFNYVRATD